VIAASLAGHDGPGSTHTPINLAHVTLQPGARLDLPSQPDFNALVYVLAGHGAVGTENRPIHIGQLAGYGAGDAIRVDAGSELAQAFEDYQKGRLGVIPAERLPHTD
jgi:redox-sensitive bicupin YhaK (pirin superfamily)